MKTYKTRVNSRKHILCSRRDSDPETVDFVVRMLIPASEIQGYFDSEFTIIYKWEHVCIVEKEFNLHINTAETHWSRSADGGKAVTPLVK